MLFRSEKYFQRIEELKQKQLEVAQVLEIAKTLGEADKHLALARQKASDILDEAAIEAKKLKEKVDNLIAKNEDLIKKNEQKVLANTTKQKELDEAIEVCKQKELELAESIKEHRALSAARSEELDLARKTKKQIEDKFAQVRKLINS